MGVLWAGGGMNFLRIAARVAALPSFAELTEKAKNVLAKVEEPELIEILNDVIALAESGDKGAYLMWQDFEEIAEEYEYARQHGRYMPDTLKGNVEWADVFDAMST